LFFFFFCWGGGGGGESDDETDSCQFVSNLLNDEHRQNGVILRPEPQEQVQYDSNSPPPHSKMKV